MRIAFRVDAGYRIGSGHFYRCLALADGLAAEGDDCEFICRELSEERRQRAEAHGHRVTFLPSAAPFVGRPGDCAHAAWLGVTWADDAEATCEALARGDGADWLAVDHYAIDHRWEAAVAPQARNVLVIDDLADRPHICSILVDQTLAMRPRQRYRRLVPPDCLHLLGPRFALLRPEFAVRRAKDVRRAVKRVVVFLGGSDPANFTSIALAGLRRLEPPIKADIVIGSDHRQRETIEALCAGDTRIRVHTSVDDMAGLLAGADLAIGAAGTSSWERASLGLPSLIVTLARNQDGLAVALTKAGMARHLGRAEDVSAAAVAEAINALRTDAAGLARMSRAACRMVDGLGVRRVAAAMHARLLALRPACETDAEILLAWRNDPLTRYNSHTSEPVAAADHTTWLAATLRNPARHLLIGEMGANRVGAVRFDRLDDGRLRVSITVSPAWRGRGIGETLLRTACRTVAPCELVAEIRAGNIASQRIFRACGFRRAAHATNARFDILTMRIAAK